MRGWVAEAESDDTHYQTPQYVPVHVHAHQSVPDGVDAVAVGIALRVTAVTATVPNGAATNYIHAAAIQRICAVSHRRSWAAQALRSAEVHSDAADVRRVTVARGESTRTACDGYGSHHVRAPFRMGADYCVGAAVSHTTQSNRVHGHDCHANVHHAEVLEVCGDAHSYAQRRESSLREALRGGKTDAQQWRPNL